MCSAVSLPWPPGDNTCFNFIQSAGPFLQSLQAINSLLNNDQCLNSAIPFICNVTQVICDDNITFEVNLQEQCTRVRDDDCAVEWRVYENFLNGALPNCASLAEDENITFSKAPALVCPDSFILYCDSFCLPSCKDFSQISADAITAARAVTITFISLGLLGGVLNLIVCILNRGKM